MTVLTRDYLGVDTDEEAIKLIEDELGHSLPPSDTKATIQVHDYMRDGNLVHGYSRQIVGLPEITDPRVKAIIASDRFEFRVSPPSKLLGAAADGYAGELHYRAKMIDGIKIANEGTRRETYYDPRFAITSTDDLGTGPFTVVKPKTDSTWHNRDGFRAATTNDPDHIWRGMAYEEWQSILSSGKIKSNGEYNMGDAQAPMTLFGKESDTAWSYADGFAPPQWQPTFEKPGYVIKIRRPENAQESHAGIDNEVEVPTETPASAITEVWELRPYLADTAEVSIRKDGSAGSAIHYSASVVGRRLERTSEGWKSVKATIQVHDYVRHGRQVHGYERKVDIHDLTKMTEILPSMDWHEPPKPEGTGIKPGGFSATGKTNTEIGDLAEKLIQQLGPVISLLPAGKRQNPLDAAWNHSGWGFEVKCFTTKAKAFKVGMKSHEVQSKLKYAEENGLRPAIMMVILNLDKGEAHAYVHDGIGNFRLSGGEKQGWKYIGSVNQ